MRMSIASLIQSKVRLVATALALAFAGVSVPAAAQDNIMTLHFDGGAGVTPVSVAIMPMSGGGRDLSGIISNDLSRSGLFQPIDPKAFVEQVGPNATPNFASWQTLNAQVVVAGQVVPTGNGLGIQVRVWDVAQGKQIAGQQFSTSANNWRQLGHLAANTAFKAVTGEPGAFDTRIAFISESGPKDKRVKRLAVMDQDGANTVYLSRGTDLVLTPRFSPTNQELTYLSFGDADPRVFLANVQTGQRGVVGNFPGMTFSPRFSPDGRKVIMSYEKNGSSTIQVLNLQSKQATQLTNGSAIDTSPSYSPDGSRIVFESDRGGTQQIYIMNADGSNQQRISSGEGGARYSTPVWSPRSDLIAFTRQKGGQFGIGIMKPDGSGERMITEGFHNEGPTWAPNGLYLMWFRDLGQGPQLWQASIFGTPEQRVPTQGFASDPAWSTNLFKQN
ncbi:Tol-Pal system protein TolB [Labrys okinawensis]|uniref:Tol-Pal system protein TolB n=1 Tax=Labrys okinawensis TaxID=346911 RepID=A0A2S9Q5X6_9HYPH|nr:Tol-Pal system beta propeller repeat protein TolB [Labrys okinawensis]PRH84684.1 Tol-Pal system protein TolB [Labrys okinawensis]